MLGGEAEIPCRKRHDEQDGDAMSGGEDMGGRLAGQAPGWLPGRALGRRNRKRWTTAAGIGAGYVLLMSVMGSVIAGTVVLVLLAAVAAGTIAALRCFGIDRDHPWVQLMRTRPWRNGEDVLRIGLRHLPEVIMVTPNGSRVAPNLVELRMNPDDLLSLAELLDMEIINASATEVYQNLLSKECIRPALDGPVQVSVVGDPSVPIGRYDLGKARLRRAGILGGWNLSWQGAPPADEAEVLDSDVATYVSTTREPAGHPVLRLVTGDRVAQTNVSGARAGRSSKLELTLPAHPTVSRVHAEFTYDNGHWWVTNLGRNGIVLNGNPVHATQVVEAGDSIRWGRRPDAPASQVEIDWPHSQAA